MCVDHNKVMFTFFHCYAFLYIGILQNFFSRQLYFKSMLDTKNRVYQSLMRSSNGGENLDVQALQMRVQELNER